MPSRGAKCQGGGTPSQGDSLTGNDNARNNYQIRRAYYVLGRICCQTERKEEASRYTKVFGELQTKTDEMSGAGIPGFENDGDHGLRHGGDAFRTHIGDHRSWRSAGKYDAAAHRGTESGGGHG